jgi:nucleoside-diphosphate-sugar epimerase
MSAERFLVTGARGFIGSWVTKNLLERGFAVTAFDVDDRSERVSLLLSAPELASVRFVRGDINDLDLLARVLREDAVSRVIHTAGLQTPACRERPIAGAAVNVLGTLAVFEAVKACRGQVTGVVYASSGAVLSDDQGARDRSVDGRGSGYLPDEAPRRPGSLYGVFKTANEECARIYWQDEGIRSVGLRPPVVYGVGRDQGLTAGTTLAIRAATLGQACEIAFSGPANMMYVEDVARCFVDCALAAPEGAPVFNMRGEILDVEDMIRIIEELLPSAKGTITCRQQRIVMANHVSDAGLQALVGPLHPLSYREGTARTAAMFRRLASEGRL